MPCRREVAKWVWLNLIDPHKGDMAKSMVHLLQIFLRYGGMRVLEDLSETFD